MVKEILGKKGEFSAKVDDDLYEHLSQWKWWVTNGGYFYRNTWIDGKRKSLYLHRAIMAAPDGVLIDHINHDVSDNRRANLRICTDAQNNQNMRKCKRPTSSKYKGVCFVKKNGKYLAQIRSNGKGKHLGQFKTEIEAAIAYNEAAKKYHGEFAMLNEIIYEQSKKENANGK